MTGYQLFTAAYSRFESSMGVGVRTSRGWPRGRSKVEIPESIDELMPSKDLLGDIQAGRIDWVAYTVRYLAQMTALDPVMLARRFTSIAEVHGRSELVLLCMCKDPRECHRGLFATHWLRTQGEPVGEVAVGQRSSTPPPAPAPLKPPPPPDPQGSLF